MCLIQCLMGLEEDVNPPPTVVGVYARQAMMMLRNVPAYAACTAFNKLEAENRRSKHDDMTVRAYLCGEEQTSEIAEICLYLGEEATIGITSRPWYRHNNLWPRIQEESKSSHLQLPRILTCAVERGDADNHVTELVAVLETHTFTRLRNSSFLRAIHRDQADCRVAGSNKSWLHGEMI
ncbi:hypothetical protein DY000_02049160 [Brassica cretica]|uniref:Uncharacterized protein n=1 Tax=Brassica cretica TaxID=69181 RepID=A0ABQ7F0C9_BRACR|nr:hypothetical protein DY000_02049160 [Brassica cretica]